jgi:predicted helicase
MIPACVVAHLKLADQLARTGFSFEQPAPIGIHLTDTLAGEQPRSPFSSPPDGYSQAADHARQVSLVQPFTVVVGNPPFSGISRSEGRWIANLLRGKESRGSSIASYYEVAGQPLAERKHWLHDDYVKFLRYAHWKIEQTGAGIVGLVTNHGYLDNPTFRGVRYQLLQTFSRIDVIDLHGNRKKKEICPDGRRDENVFGIEQGTAIGLFRRAPGTSSTIIRHREVWGSSTEKLRELDAEATGVPAAAEAAWERTTTLAEDHATALNPALPNFFFVPRDESRDAEYRSAHSLPEMMPIHVTAPVTARDGFVVAFDRDELRRRFREFRDLSVPDESIRQRHFGKTRSVKYPPGDTRGWRLAEARRRVVRDNGWIDRIRTCWYRPFDRRYVYWSRDMIDWPRDQVMSHLLSGDNLALVARRQMLPSQPCTYFWIVDDLTLDGVIRSDNRGTESVFPLYLYERDSDGQRRRRANLDDGFVGELQDALRLHWVADGVGDLIHTFGPEDVLCYTYALFHSPTYRQRYADSLRAGFPRVFLPCQPALFAALVAHGRRLADAHLLRSPPAKEAEGIDSDKDGEDDRWLVAAGYPKYVEGCVQVNASRDFTSVSPETWAYHVGGHQVCRKWLKDRRGRRIGAAQRHTYRQMLLAVGNTLMWMQDVDRSVAVYGGWPQAFRVGRSDGGT